MKLLDEIIRASYHSWKLPCPEKTDWGYKCMNRGDCKYKDGRVCRLHEGYCADFFKGVGNFGRKVKNGLERIIFFL